MEKNKNIELGSSSLVEKKIAELKRGKRLVTKVNLFSGDEDDEFKVILGSGETIGIFKTWAVPVIPFLESNQEVSLLDWEVVEEWENKMKGSPVLAWEELEKWRNISELSDRRLFKIFSERKLPEDKNERLTELFWRLKIAFAFAAPFYHIEAMVGDGNETPGNPFSGDQDSDTQGGFLDMAGMLLPSALGDLVHANKLDWNNLNWNTIETETSNIRDLDKLAILMRVARKAGTTIEQVVFAANALEWIPVSVGGKKGDLEERDAVNQLLKVDGFPKELSLASIARDMNGLIRFLNWTTIEKDQENFDKSAGWKYAAVCETSNQIIAELADASQIVPGHRKEFLEKILPQLSNLDASSARGRFALWMFENNWIEKQLLKTVAESENRMVAEIAAKMVEMELNETTIPLGESNNRFLVGGKAAGLYEAIKIFGKELVGDGVVVTSEALNNWMAKDSNIAEQISTLNKTVNIEDKIWISNEITKKIQRLEFPKSISERVLMSVSGDRLAVRSSSFDEDTLVNGTAAGIYESEVGVKRADLGIAIKKVLCSFFSEKAVSYRHLHGLSDEPVFAVLIHVFDQGAGGVVFSKGNGDDWTIFTGETPGNVVGGHRRFDMVEKNDGEIIAELTNGWMKQDTIELFGDLSVLAEHVLGGRTDMEFLENQKGSRILQLRMLNSKSERNEVHKEDPKKWFKVSNLQDLGALEIKESAVGLMLDDKINIDQFQGELFRCLVRNKDKISAINLSHRIPRTSHFANICLNLGIKLVFRND